jgi:putative transposase
VTLKVPKLCSLPFETAIIDRYRWRESSVEEALVEMYLAGVSVRRVEDITEALCGTRVYSGSRIAAEPEDLPPHRGLAQPQGTAR